MYVFVDESGDLGFKELSTKFFIVAYIECESPTKLQVEMKKALKVLHQHKKYHYSENELKFSLMNQKCREYVLQKISACDLSVNAMVVEKTKVHPNLRGDPPRLYNYLVVHNIIFSLLPQMVTNKKFDITFDRSLPSWRIKEFNEYVNSKASFLLSEKGSSFEQGDISLRHDNSELNPCVQAADAVANAYFQKYEKKNSAYADIIADKVGYFNYLWK
jgi:hypothetical protein